MTYRPRLKPRKHQNVALKRMFDAPRRGFALLMEMGTGKTKVVLDEYGYRHDSKEIKNLLVVAPAGVYMNWHDPHDHANPETEINKHLDPALREEVLVGVWRSSRGKKSVREFLELKRPRIMIVNVEALSSVPACVEACENFLSQGPAVMCVDESTTIKSHSAERAKRARELGEFAALRRVATGLVTPKSPMDLWGQFNFLDQRILGSGSFYGFRARYAVLKNMEQHYVDHEGKQRTRQFKQIVAYRNEDELRERIAPHSYRVLKSECLDLPPKIYRPPVRVTLSKEQRRAYDEMLEFCTTALSEDTHVTATAVITQILRLHQILCGHVVDENGGMHDLPCPRIERHVLEWCEEVRDKGIIWVPYERSLLKIAAVLEKAHGPGSVARYWGGNRATRREEVARWRQEGRRRWILSTQSAGGWGNTWNESSSVLYFASTNNLEHRAQSEDRNHRDGQTESVDYTDFVAPGTVDEKILVALRKKINMATAITGENYREWLI